MLLLELARLGSVDRAQFLPLDLGLAEIEFSLLNTLDRLDLDLKVAGLITLFVAPGLALLGWFLSLLSAKALLPLLGVSALVGFVSIGLLVASKSIERSYREDKASAPGNRLV